MKKIYIFLIGVFFFALFIRIGFLSRANFIAHNADGWEYLEFAYNLANGKGYVYNTNSPRILYKDILISGIPQKDGYISSSWRPPLYPLFMGVIFRFTSDNIRAVKIAQVFVSSVTVMLFFLLGLLIFNYKVGIISALIASLYPFLIFFSVDITTETLFLFLFLLIAIMALVSFPKRYVWIQMLSVGVLIGLASLCRPIGLIYPFLIAIWIFFLHKGAKIYIRRILLMLGGFLLVLSPWTIRNYKVHKAFVPVSTHGGMSLWTGNNWELMRYCSSDSVTVILEQIEREMSGLREVERSDLFLKKALHFIQENPKDFLKLVKLRFLGFFKPSLDPQYYSIRIRLISIISYLPILIFGFAGLCFLKKELKKFSLVLLLSFSSVFVHVVFVSGIVRYRIPIFDSVLIFLSAVTITNIMQFKWCNIYRKK